MPSPRDIARSRADQVYGKMANSARTQGRYDAISKEVGRGLKSPFKRRWQVSTETFKPGVNGRGTPKLPSQAQKRPYKAVGPMNKGAPPKKPTTSYNDWSASARTQSQQPSYNPGTRMTGGTPGSKAPWSVDNQKLKPGLNGTGTPGYQRPPPKKTVPSKRAV